MDIEIANITEIRQNASKIISKVVKEKRPTLVLQRSKPVAYIVEASVFEDMQKCMEVAQKYNEIEESKMALERLDKVTEKMKKRKIQSDSTVTLRNYREGNRDE
ncbi:MAG: type II toxin-antitoxin system prevent-host-death family antitoxin [Tepidanaerobacteraceae bacterium]|jgi:antitoxin StbD